VAQSAAAVGRPAVGTRPKPTVGPPAALMRWSARRSRGRNRYPALGSGAGEWGWSAPPGAPGGAVQATNAIAARPAFRAAGRATADESPNASGATSRRQDHPPSRLLLHRARKLDARPPRMRFAGISRISAAAAALAEFRESARPRIVRAADLRRPPSARPHERSGDARRLGGLLGAPRARDPRSGACG